MNTFRFQTKSKTILADLYTPVGVYMRLRDLYPQSALMESSDYHDANNSRSFIGLNPIASVAIGHGIATVSYPDGSTFQHEVNKEYRSDKAIHELIDHIEVSGEDAAVCGLFGYTSFNAVRYFEDIPVKDETQAKNDAPDVLYILYKVVIEFDHHNNMLKIVTLSENSDNSEYSDNSENSDITAIQKAMNKANVQAYDFHPVGDVRSTLTDDEHRANIRKGIQHCLRGDVFQIVLSRRFIQKYEGDDFKLYRALRSINPSPYLFYFDFGGFRIFGSSPETHCRIEGKKAYIDPIAGTTKRTGDAEADRRGAEYLRNDPKENAEHVMLVDLARNDLSRNCHHVKVDFYKDLQYYSHVIHLVSRVSGELDEGADPIKAFIDTFPAGTLSGAPKVRAMQLISEYEPHNRGAYGGCIGIIGLDGSLNQAITIRTFVSRNGELWFQAGGGIVAKSDVEYELQEVNNKLGALRKAIEKAATL
jgi:anthranilate synthase component 1